MNYERIYAEFIADRRSKESSLIGYTEKHHIVPRSLGGTDETSNLIALTAGDHLFAHMLLAKAYGSKMMFALNRMLCAADTNKRIVCGKRYRLAYKMARTKFGERISEMFKDPGFSKKHAKNTSEKTKEAFKDPEIKARHLAAVSQFSSSDEYRVNLSKAQRKRYETSESRKVAGRALKRRWDDHKTRSELIAAQEKAALNRCRQIVNLSTGAIFAGEKRAGESCGVTRKAIANAIKRNGTSGGYRWAYVKEMKAAA